MFSFPVHAHCLLALAFFGNRAQNFLEQLTSSDSDRIPESLRPVCIPPHRWRWFSPLLTPLATARLRGIAGPFGREDDSMGAEQTLWRGSDSYNARELLRGGEWMKRRSQRGEDTELFLPAEACGGGWLGLITSLRLAVIHSDILPTTHRKATTESIAYSVWFNYSERSSNRLNTI